MIRQIPFEEDFALKRFSNATEGEVPRFNWREIVFDESLVQPEIKITSGDIERDFDLTEVADTIGGALTNLLLSRKTGPNDIFTVKNQQFVAEVAHYVSEQLVKQIEEGIELNLSSRDIHLLIEKALIDHDAHDIARSLVINRNKDDSGMHTIKEVSVIRRNGQIAPWSQDKIEVAIRKAFLTLRNSSAPALSVASAVTARVLDLGHTRIHIEEIQDLVQEELMRQGHYKEAEAYILYRAHRARLRREAVAQAVEDTRQESMIVIRNEDGQTYFWDGIELKKRIEFARIGLDLNLTSDEIEQELRRSLFSEMSAVDVKQTIILNAKTLIEKDAEFARFAGRILLTYIYEEVLGWDIIRDGIGNLKPFHKTAFLRFIKNGIAIERLHKRLTEYDLEKLADAIDPSADLDLDYLGVQTLYDRYLIIDKTKGEPKRIETPQIFWMRVSMGLFIDEKENREDWVTRLYNLYKTRRFCSSTPTLFNSGTPHPQLSSCYLYKVDDNIESIMIRGIAENAFLSKWAGGLGGSWSAIRGTGSYIKGTNGESQGVIPFLKLHNDQLVAVNQGGKRRGSGCAYLETWHNDIFDFLDLRKNTGDDRRRTHDLNTANWIPDLFMKRMEGRQHWTLFRANEVPDLHELHGLSFEKRYEQYEDLAERGEIWGQKIKAIDLWKKMLSTLFETGHPWITFKDSCNIRNPQDHVGIIHSSNLCTEITLNTDENETAVCNLGSIVLDSHLNDDGSLDSENLRATIRVAVRALDNVIDLNFYPTEAARRSNHRHRPIGLGVMGVQNALYLRGESFASQEAIEFNDEFMEAIAMFAYEASSDLAAERGTYESYAGSKWDRGILPQDSLDMLEKNRGVRIDVPRGGQLDWDPLRKKIAQHGMRNSNVIAIAPTATISNIMGTSPCIEPTYKNLYVKSNLSGDFIVLNAHLVRDLKSLGLWNGQMIDNIKYFDGELQHIEEIPDVLKSRYLTAFDIEYHYFIDAAARRQKWIDQSQSLNLFLAKPELKTLSHMYRAAWHKGLKTTYYLRTLGASNIEKATVSAKKEMRGVVSRTDGDERLYTEEEKSACSLDAMLNGESCEACQ